MARGAYHHGDLRRALINAALQLVTRDEPAALTLRAVAREAAVSHAAPYRHFQDKAELLAAVAAEGFTTLVAEQRRAIAQVGESFIDRFRACGLAYVETAVAHPGHFRVMFGVEVQSVASYPALAKASDEAFSLLLDLIAEGQGLGLIRAGEPRDLGVAAWSIVHGLSSLLVAGRLSGMGSAALSTRDWADLVTRQLLEGQGARGLNGGVADGKLPCAVAVVLKRSDGRILLVRRAKNRPAALFWTPVTGRIEAGEAPREAARREVKEETGLEVIVGDEVHESLTSDACWRLRWFEAELRAGSDPDVLELATEELVDARWCTPEELVGLRPMFPATRAYFNALR